MEMNNKPPTEHQSATVKHFCFNIENAGLYYRNRIGLLTNNYQKRRKLQSNVRQSLFSVNLRHSHVVTLMSIKVMYKCLCGVSVLL